METTSNANFPLTSTGRTYHVGTLAGETANRIITVGSPSRAEVIAAHLSSITHRVTSKRGYTTITGIYNSIPVSIIAIGMGSAMADFFIREIHATTESPIAIIRFGSCGSISSSASLGDIVVADKAAYISRNVDHFIAPTSTSTPYHISNLVAPDPSLTNLLYDKLGETMMVNKGINLSADSFYGSQGRIDPGFVDENSKLIGDVKERYVDAMTLEMESFYLIHLAKCCKSDIRIACCAMVFAQRESNEFLAPSVISDLEMNGGRILLDVITQYTF